MIKRMDEKLSNYHYHCFIRISVIILEISIFPILGLSYLVMNLFKCNCYMGYIDSMNKSLKRIVVKTTPRMWSAPEDARKPELVIGAFFTFSFYLILSLNLYNI